MTTSVPASVALVLSHDWAAGGILPGFKIHYKGVETRRSQSSRWLPDRCDCSHLTFICSSPSCCSGLTVMFRLCWVVIRHSSMVKYTLLNLLYMWQHPVRRPSSSVTSYSSSCKSQQNCRDSIICCSYRGKVAVEVRNMETSIYLEKKHRFAPFSENTEATNGALSFSVGYASCIEIDEKTCIEIDEKTASSSDVFLAHFGFNGFFKR